MLWGTALGSSFGEPLWGAALASFPEQLSGTIALKNSGFGEQLSGVRGSAFSSNFRGQLSGAALQTSFGEPFWGIGLKNRSFGAIALDSSFGEELLAATLGRSFRQPLCRMALGSRFGEEVCRIAESQLWGNSFGQLSGPALRQLWAAALESWGASLGRSFR